MLSFGCLVLPAYVWKHEFDQGKKYYVTVEACNRAGLCRVTSSSSLTFDNSPPSPGRVTVGFDGHHSKFWGHKYVDLLTVVEVLHVIHTLLHQCQSALFVCLLLLFCFF